MCVIAFAASSITAVSCGKTPAAGGGNTANNNSGSGGSGGSGGGGGGTPAPTQTGSIVIENIDNTIAELKGDKIELKAGGFPTTSLGGIGGSIDTVRAAATGSMKRAFDIIIKDTNNVAATGGLLFVSTGDKTGFADFSLRVKMENGIGSTFGGPTIPGFHTALERKEGGPLTGLPVAADGANELTKLGWNVYGVFMNDATPTSGAANTTPFAFSATGGGQATHPVLLCRTTIPAITDHGLRRGIQDVTSAGVTRDDTVLAGGQKASCYVGAFGSPFTNRPADAWLKETAGNTFKKEFEFAVAGVKTDAKALNSVGFTGDAKAVLRDAGLNGAQMTAVAAANPSAFKKFSVSIVRDASFTYTYNPADALVVQNLVFPGTGVKVVDGTNIFITHDAFSGTTRYPGIFWDFIRPTSAADPRRKMFEITNTGGTAGLVLVAKGSVNSAADITWGNVHTYDSTSQSDAAHIALGGATDSGGIPAGMTFMRVFMNDNNPTTTAELASDAEPFAFSGIIRGGKPAIWCMTTIPGITSTTAGAIPTTSTLTGGQVVSCHGGKWPGTSADWFGAADPFKRKFTISVAAIETGTKTLADIGLPGADAAAKLGNLTDGLTAAEMADIIAANGGLASIPFKKFHITVVRTLP